MEPSKGFSAGEESVSVEISVPLQSYFENLKWGVSGTLWRDDFALREAL